MEQQRIPLAGIGALLLASAALMGSPGPSTMSVTAVGAAFGLRRSLAYTLGLVLGTCLVLGVVATGVFTVLLSVPRLAPVLTAASAPSFAGGLLLATANPKAYVAIAAVFAGSRLPGLSPSAEALAKTTLLALMVVLIHLGWLMAGASLSRVLRDPVASRIVNMAFAMVLVATSVFAVLPR